ncbi:hypothetical protein [Serratia marcescens]|uniref:hypothetical protein n=1 Tax=Serratia marcescens TaxID=615 RepID=UPI0011E6F1D6|nr:hypothetical protein [Serratia marcescens]
MSHLILTKDIYLYSALSALLLPLSVNRKICIIDIESYRSLRMIYRLLSRDNLINEHRVIFIGGANVSSKVLEPLVTVYRKSGFTEFYRQLTEGRTCSLESSLNHIEKCLNLHMLTRRERRVLYAIRDANDTRAAAKMSYLSTSTFYAYSRRIGEKLNLKSILHVRQFIFSEFVLKERVEYSSVKRLPSQLGKGAVAYNAIINAGM